MARLLLVFSLLGLAVCGSARALAGSICTSDPHDNSTWLVGPTSLLAGNLHGCCAFCSFPQAARKRIAAASRQRIPTRGRRQRSAAALRLQDQVMLSASRLLGVRNGCVVNAELGVSLFPTDAISCGADGLCYRGTTKCRSSMDDPLCNIPLAPAATDVEASLQNPLTAWRACRQDSLKLRSLTQRADLYGGEPILDAALTGRPDALELLLQEGVDVNARGRGGATALHMASLLPQGTRVLQLLLANGADVNEVDAFGFTPLHRAIQSQSVEGATMLLYSGANLTIAAPGGETPLHLAAYENSRELAQLLLAFGANPFARNDRGATSFEVGLFDMSVPPHHMT